jgi:hypothetical protein
MRGLRGRLCAFNFDEENEGYIYVFSWFTIYRNAPVSFRETLTLDDIVAENETTQTKNSHVIDEPVHLVEYNNVDR